MVGTDSATEEESGVSGQSKPRHSQGDPRAEAREPRGGFLTSWTDNCWMLAAIIPIPKLALREKEL